MIAAGVLVVALTAHAPAAVPVDDRLPVQGRAPVADGSRTVLLQERSATGEWYRVARQRTRPTGWFRISIRSGHALTERTLRVVAPPSSGLSREATPPFDVDVVLRGRIDR